MVWLVVHLVTTAVLTGVAWVSFVVIYPAFALVGPAEWGRYHAAHVRAITRVVALPWAVQGVSTARTPYRMVVAHHRSMLRFWWRSTTPSHRLLAPVVGLGVAVRAGSELARRALEARRAG